MNCYIQRKSADFTRLSVFVSNIIEELKLLKAGNANWCSDAASLQAILEEDHCIAVTNHTGITRGSLSATSAAHFRVKVVILYLSALIENIERRFSRKVVELLTASSIFSPSLFPTKYKLLGYGDNEIRSLASFMRVKHQ